MMPRLLGVVTSADKARPLDFVNTTLSLDKLAAYKEDMEIVGETTFSMDALFTIGEALIAAFGPYQWVFWNCQVFAKIYLRLITGSQIYARSM